MEDDNAQARRGRPSKGQENDVDSVSDPATCLVRCIVSVKPWADVLEEGSTVLRPLDLDEVVRVRTPLAHTLQNNRHAIIVGQ